MLHTLPAPGMLDPSAFEDAFRDAVTALDGGDVVTLTRMLDRTPALATTRLVTEPPWLLTMLGGAVPEFFSRPYLLWFVAEDPVRNGSLPPNIAEVARVIIAVARGDAPETLQDQLDHCLRLVAWSWIARDADVQIALIDVLVDAGASPDGRPNDALVNRNVDAAAHLIARGAPVTLAAAACLGRWDDVRRLGASVGPAKRRFAFVLAALNGNADALRALLALGVDVNARCPDLYPHGTPLHHAVSSGSLAAVQVLVDAHADVDAVDSAWNGTPLGWALYAVEQKPKTVQEADARAAIVRFLTEHRPTP